VLLFVSDMGRQIVQVTAPYGLKIEEVLGHLFFISCFTDPPTQFFAVLEKK
jgi:hypothetical protein